MSVHPSAEAVRLAHATLAFAHANPAVLESSPFAVISDVLAQPPWSLDWRDAMRFVSDAMTAELEPDGHTPWCDEAGCHPDFPENGGNTA